MNNIILNRLKSLWEKLGLSVSDGSISNAEIMAYASALSLLQENMENVLKNIFIDTADFSGISMFLSMVNEKPQGSDTDSKTLVINAVSDDVGIYSRTEFEIIVSEIGDTGATYTTTGNVMDFNYSSTDSRKQLEVYSKQANDYNPCTLVINNNAGRKFSAWDNKGFRWYELDSYNLPFATIDTLA